MSIPEENIWGDTILRSLIKKAYNLAMIHIEDGDELGELAADTLALINAKYPKFFKELSEHDGET